MRYLIDVNKYDDQNSTTNPLLYVLNNVNTTSNRSLIMYYPNNSFVQSIVENAYLTIKAIQPMFNATSII